jgi:hypothetical protein
MTSEDNGSSHLGGKMTTNHSASKNKMATHVQQYQGLIWPAKNVSKKYKYKMHTQIAMILIYL